MCSAGVERPLCFLVCLRACTRILSQEHLMKAHRHSTPGVCPETSEHGETVSISVDDHHPLLQLKRALPWAALCEVRTRRWAAAGNNTVARPGFTWEWSLYVLLVAFKIV